MNSRDSSCFYRTLDIALLSLEGIKNRSTSNDDMTELVDGVIFYLENCNEQIVEYIKNNYNYDVR